MATKTRQRNTRAAPEKKKKSAAGKVIAWILVILLVAAAALAAGYYFLRDQGVTFYVEYGGTRYYANSDGGSIGLKSGETHSFSVKSLTGGEINFSAKVISNEANNFGFFVGGEFHRFYDDDEQNDDYSDVFGLTKSPNGFTVTISETMTVESAVEEKFGGDISPQTELQKDVCYFVITVTADGSSVNMWFKIDELLLSIDPPSIIF